MKHIIDISEHQAPQEINYAKLSPYLDLVIIRTQFGSRRIDKHFESHHLNFKREKVPTAAYAWVRGISLADMKKEAKDFYQRTAHLQPEIWFLDVEEQSMKNMRAGISMYIQTLKSLGAKRIGIYIAHHRYRQFNLKVSEADLVWLPHYGKNNGQVTSNPDFPCDLHQYTDKGRLPGYKGYLDLNRTLTHKLFSKSDNTFKAKGQRIENSYHQALPFFDSPRWHHPDGVFHPKEGWILLDKIIVEDKAMYQVKNTKNDIYYITADSKYVTMPQANLFHTVKSGDTLSALAIKYGTTIQELQKWNTLKDIHKIYVGDKLRVG